MSSAPPPRPASTVVLVRDDPDAREGFAVFLVKRHGKSGFMAGAHVFPGGRVDGADGAWAPRLDDAARIAASRAVPGVAVDVAVAYAVAAIRETAEECGVLLAVDDARARPPGAVAARVAARLAAGDAFTAVLDDERLVPDVAALAPLAWWITPAAEPKRFDTRFFLARAPADHTASSDRRETTEGEWLAPGAALDAYAAGRIALAPPTLATLEDLAAAGSVDAALAAAAPTTPIEPVLTHDGAGALVLALPGDALHPTAARCSPRRTRVVLDGSGRFASR